MLIVICFHYSNTKGYQKISWFMVLQNTPQEDNFFTAAYKFISIQCHFTQKSRLFSQKHMCNNMRTLHINLSDSKKKSILLKSHQVNLSQYTLVKHGMFNGMLKLNSLFMEIGIITKRSPFP